jgi:hypothetical protein
MAAREQVTVGAGRLRPDEHDGTSVWAVLDSVECEERRDPSEHDQPSEHRDDDPHAWIVNQICPALTLVRLGSDSPRSARPPPPKKN